MGEPRPGSVLFACGMNAIRSPMAEALARHLFPGQFYIQSVGVRCGKPDPFAAAVMDEIGLDISEHEPTTFDDLEDSYFDLIISLAPEAHHRARSNGAGGMRWRPNIGQQWTRRWPLARAEQIMDSLSCGARGADRQAPQGPLSTGSSHGGGIDSKSILYIIDLV